MQTTLAQNFPSSSAVWRVIRRSPPNIAFVLNIIILKLAKYFRAFRTISDVTALRSMMIRLPFYHHNCRLILKQWQNQFIENAFKMEKVSFFLGTQTQRNWWLKMHRRNAFYKQERPPKLLICIPSMWIKPGFILVLHKLPPHAPRCSSAAKQIICTIRFPLYITSHPTTSDLFQILHRIFCF